MSIGPFPAKTEVISGLQGARVADTAFIDTLDIMDIDCLEIGKDAVIGEGATITAHTFKNGTITFSKVNMLKHRMRISPQESAKFDLERRPFLAASRQANSALNMGIVFAILRYAWLCRL